MNVFELWAKLGLNTSEYDEALSDAESRTSGFGSAVARGLGVVGAATGAAISAAAVGVGKLTVASVQAYADFEQLSGGVEKIFGESAETVSEYADIAYQTAGLSANEYMETVTGFSASLLQGLGGDTEAAAEIANKAIIDMSDNANTFGTDMESIQNAYMGFAKGNYTMLDNLKLGYGGTAEEMLRLINDSGILEEQITSLDDVTFDQMIAAIHAVQEELNIAGTTRNEAATTISGSIGMLQGAWQNLVIGMADENADMSTLIGNVVESAKTVVDNLVPVISQALGGIATLISEVAPIIADELPGLIDTILPPLLSAASQIVSGVVKSLPSILSSISKAIPQALNQLIPAVLSILPDLIVAGGELVSGLATGLMDNADLIMDSAVDLIDFLANDLLTPENIESMITVATQLIFTLSQALIEHEPDLISAAITIVVNVAEALAESLPEIAVQLGEFIVNLGDDLGNWLYDMFGDQLVVMGECFTDSLNKVANFGADIIAKMVDIGADIIATVVDFMGGAGLVFNFDDMIAKVTQFGSDLWEDITGIFDHAKEIVSDAIDALVDFFDFDWELPDIKLPHFTLTGEFSLENMTVPSIGIEWYAKAYNQPYMLDGATIFGMAGGKMLGGGERGDEMIYGRSNLMSDITQAVAGVVGNMPINVTVYIGDEQVEDIMVNSEQRYNLISGGRG